MKNLARQMAVTLLLAAAAAASGQDDGLAGGSEEGVSAAPRQRLDFGLEFFDAVEGNTATGAFTYTWVPYPSHGLAVILPVSGADLSETEGTGIGDALIQYSYVPSARLTASPWVPNGIGMGAAVIVPSGDPARGLGGDRWIIIPSLGWVFNVNKRLSILPSLQFSESFGEGESVERLRFANLELGFLYVTRSEFWVSYVPSWFRDFEPEPVTRLDHTLILGQQITRIFAMSLEAGTLERPRDPDSPSQRGADRRAALNFHFVLPWGRSARSRR